VLYATCLLLGMTCPSVTYHLTNFFFRKISLYVAIVFLLVLGGYLGGFFIGGAQGGGGGPPILGSPLILRKALGSRIY